MTGAGQGIGRAVAAGFAREGARVLAFDVEADPLDQTVSAVAAAGGMTAGVVGDVSERADVSRAVGECVERFGRPDVLAAVAGVTGVQPLLDIDDASWHRMLSVNPTGAFLCPQEAGRAMAKSGGGAMAVTASTSAF